MSDEQERGRNESEPDAETSFAETSVPHHADVPEAPELSPKLPPHPKSPSSGGVEPGSYSNTALAFTAANSFIMPILVLSLGGWYLDKKMHHQTSWFALTGVLVGLIVGATALANVMKRMT